MQPYAPSLARLAHLARRDSELLANVLYGYMEDTQVDDIQLAAYLECPVDVLPRLALCLQPRPAPQFRLDVQEIAAHLGIALMPLVQVIRHVPRRELWGWIE